MKTIGQIASIQVGQPTTYSITDGVPNDGRPATWTSGFAKEQVSGTQVITETGVEGDGQADMVHHGGRDKAVLVYALAHYPRWQKELGLPMSGGAFGENLTLNGIDESSMCIGDVVAMGEVILQVSQARVPCWKISRRWGVPDLLQKVQENGRTGWYFRVLLSGTLEAGQDVQLVSRGQPNWTIYRVNNVIHGRINNLAEIAELAIVPELASAQREMVQGRLRKRNS